MRLLTTRFNRDHQPHPNCPICRGLGTVQILPFGYDEWHPESWPTEACPRCRTAPLLESLGFKPSELHYAPQVHAA